MKDIVFRKKNNDVFTTSIMIAENFKKSHKNVLKKIESLPDDDFNRLNFEPISYVDDQGRTQPMVEMTRDGFSYIAMSFTGKEAHVWKVRFIDAFNKMERHLRNMVKKEWLENRHEAALEYRLMARTLKEVRQLQGKETQGFHYANEAKLVNWALTGKYKKVDRNTLPREDLCVLVVLEAYNAVMLGVGHDRETRKELLKNRFLQAMEDLNQSPEKLLGLQ